MDSLSFIGFLKDNTELKIFGRLRESTQHRSLNPQAPCQWATTKYFFSVLIKKSLWKRENTSDEWKRGNTSNQLKKTAACQLNSISHKIKSYQSEPLKKLKLLYLEDCFQKLSFQKEDCDTNINIMLELIATLDSENYDQAEYDAFRVQTIWTISRVPWGLFTFTLPAVKSYTARTDIWV